MMWAAVRVFNLLSRTAEMGRPPSGFGEGITNVRLKQPACCEMLYLTVGLLFLGGSKQCKMCKKLDNFYVLLICILV